MTYHDNGYYEGDWDSDTKHGKGLRLYGDGGIYTGEWKYDQMSAMLSTSTQILILMKDTT
jgi:hypothetical protein